MELLKTLSKAWHVKEIRAKILFTLMIMLIFRIGSNIPVPGINRDYLAQMFKGQTGLLDLFDLFSGGAFSNFTIFALSITPYVTASIIVQLLTIAFPYFERLSKEGNEGRKKMATITRYLTIVLGLIQATGLTIGLFRRAIVNRSAFSMIVIIMVLTAGTAFLMWLGEQINEYGVGNGISLNHLRRHYCKDSNSYSRNSHAGQRRGTKCSSCNCISHCGSVNNGCNHTDAAGNKKDSGTVR